MVVSAPQALTYRLVTLHPLTDTVIQLQLAPAAQHFLSYQAGQYLELQIQSGEARPFSIANAPLGTRRIELHLRHTPDNLFTTAIIQQLQQTGELTLRGPHGHCLYDPAAHRPLLFLAAGTGFAPMKALIEQALTLGESEPMQLIWGANHRNDLYLDDCPKAWADHIDQFTYTPILSQPQDPNWPGLTGLISDYLDQLSSLPANTACYLAGPPEMVAACKSKLIQLGVPNSQCFSDI